MTITEYINNPMPITEYLRQEGTNLEIVRCFGDVSDDEYEHWARGPIDMEYWKICEKLAAGYGKALHNLRFAARGLKQTVETDMRNYNRTDEAYQKTMAEYPHPLVGPDS